MKRILSILLAVMMVTLVVSGCKKSSGTTTGKTAKITVGCSVYYYSAFISLMAVGVKREAKAEGANLTLLDANNNAQTQLSQIQDLIAKKVSVILVAAVDTNAIVPALQMCKNAKIPLVAVNMLINTKEPYDYVGPNDVQAGEKEMQALIDKIGGKGNIVILEGPIGTSAQLQRLQGDNNVLKKYPDVHVLACQTANWDRAQAQTLTENWIQAFPGKINGICAHNDEMGMGALQAIKAKGLNTPITAVDAIQDGCVSIKAGTPFFATVYQNADLEGSLGVKTAILVAKGGTPSVEKNYIDMQLITNDNVDTLLNTIYKSGSTSSK
jgi:ABC-type sugar transport system substrate-binding protein